MRELLSTVKRSLMLTLSAPIKPGAIHRLVPDSDFERRLYEVMEVIPYIDEAYRKSQLVAEGRLSSKELGLGLVIGKALRSAFDASGELPLVGLWSAAVVAGAIEGYSETANLKIPDNLKLITTRLLYGSSTYDVEALIEALSDVGDSDLLQFLENNGVSPGNIQLRAPTLGDLFEVAQGLDKGFMINSRGVEQIMGLSKLFDEAKGAIAGVVKVYMQLASEVIKGPDLALASRSLDPAVLLKLDKTLAQNRVTLNRTLGGVFLASYIYGVTKGLTI